MHPAASIIFFTTLSGFGYGLAAALGLGFLDPAAVATKAAHIVALALISTGLLSSTLHLGNPQRAWRALSQWRSSWLSREGVLAILAFLPLTASAWLSIVADRMVPAIGLAGSVLCVATVYCTSMIYGSLKSIQAWHTPLTPLCYLLFSAAGGALLLAFAAWGGGLDVAPFVAAASLLILAAWAAKWVWWGRLRSMAPLSTAETATGLGAIGKVRLFERPHMTENYLTNEMGYRIARKHARKLSGIATFWGGLAAVAVLVLPYLVWPTAGLLPLLPALLLFGAGVAVERWLFFAEARHAVMNYYGG